MLINQGCKNANVGESKFDKANVVGMWTRNHCDVVDLGLALL